MAGITEEHVGFPAPLSVLSSKGDRWLDKPAPLNDSRGNYLLVFSFCSNPQGTNLKIIITMRCHDSTDKRKSMTAIRFD